MNVFQGDEAPRCSDPVHHAAGCACAVLAGLRAELTELEQAAAAFKVKVEGAGIHLHEFHRIFRQANPKCDVEDCACGARRRVYPGPAGVPTIVEDIPKPGGAAENCLIVLDDRQGYASLLGDPQGERFKTLLKEKED